MLLLLTLAGNAQNFRWSSSLPPVPAPGFYRIPLGIEWRQRLKPDLSDLRLQDGSGVSVPYLVDAGTGRPSEGFFSLPVLSSVTDSAFTTLEIANRAGGINRLLLVLGNTGVTRLASLSGSNNRQQWFVLQEGIPLEPAALADDDRYLQSLAIPFVRYPYLKLRIFNGRSDPLAVREVGVPLAAPPAKPLLQAVPGLSVQRTDSSNGFTYIYLSTRFPVPARCLQLFISAPRYYRREAVVYEASDEKLAHLAGDAWLQSGGPNQVLLQPAGSRSWILRISNGENQPLLLDSVQLLVQQAALYAYLEPGRHYQLLGGNTELAAPRFDLAYFRDSIPLNVPLLVPAAIREQTAPAKPPSPFKRWLWPALALAILSLGLLTFRLAREVGNNA